LTDFKLPCDICVQHVLFLTQLVSGGASCDVGVTVYRLCIGV